MSGQLGADVGRQVVEEEEKEHRVWLITGRQQGQQLVHEGGGTNARDMREGHKLSRQLPAGWCVGLQQMVFYQLVQIRCVVGEAVHDVADVIENIRGHLGEDVVPLLLRRHNMRPAKNGISLLEPSFRLLAVKGEQLNRNMRSRSVEGGGTVSGVHRCANMCSVQL